MAYVVLCSIAFLASTLTLSTGFGLGGLMLPFFAIWMPPRVALTSAALVAMLNNLFRAVLLGKKADYPTVARFAIPAALCAVAASKLAEPLDALPGLLRYECMGHACKVTIPGLLSGGLIAALAVVELLPRYRQLKVDRKYLPFGGALSGLFGGVSGRQGAFRSAFLVRAGLEKEPFIATVVVSTVIVKLALLSGDGVALMRQHFDTLWVGERMALVGAATLAAVAGSVAGLRVLRRATMDQVQDLICLLLFLAALALAMGAV